MLVFALLLLSVGKLQGQDASLQGIVTSDGGPLASVLVTLEAQGQVVRGVGTDRNGLFQIGSVTPGTYTLRLRLLGYAPHEQTVALEAGQRLTINVRLEVSAVALQGIEVSVGAEGAAISDFGVQRITPTQLQAGAINAYDRTNIFYYDLFTQRRVDQLPLAPYAAITLRSR